MELKVVVFPCMLFLVQLLYLVGIGVCQVDQIAFTSPSFTVYPDNVFSRGRLFYRTLMLDEEGNAVYIGAMNHLFRLWMFNVNDTENQAFYAEKELKPSSEDSAKCAYSIHDPNFHCRNHIRLIFKLRDNSLYICGTNAYSPVVTKLDSNTLAILDSDISGVGICAFDPNDNGTAVYVENGNPDQIPSVYSGSVTDYTQTNRIIYRPPLLDSAGRFLHQFMRTVHTDSKWLNEAQFVGSFEQGQYVYFFFRETAIEFTNCGKAIYSRVARICKNDVGGQHVLKQNWATFVKARLNCSLDGEFPFYFDQIQDIYKVDLEPGEAIIYGTFTTNLNGFYGSAVCAYSLRQINAIFDSGTFKEQISSSAAWLPVLPSRVPDPRPGKCVENTKSISDGALHFIKSHPLLDDSIGCVGGKPIFFKRNLILTKLSADTIELQDQKYVAVFAGSDSGDIYKLLHWSVSGNYESLLLAVYRLPSREPIRAITTLKNEFVYVAQDGAVSQLGPAQCTRYQSCGSCTLDPYCSWNNVRQQCARAHESHHFTAGWVISQPQTESENSRCETHVKKETKLLYPGDAVHLDCPAASFSDFQGDNVKWMKNNKSLDIQSGRHLLTTDGGLVIVNSSLEDSGRYDCFRGRQIVFRYQIFVDKVNCQKPHNVKAFQSVYREWCREFQEYKHTMLKWKQWYEQNTQCSKNVPDFKKLPSPPSFEAELKSNRLTNNHM